MARYVRLDLTEAEAEAVEYALTCEIPARHSAAHDRDGKRIDLPRGEGAIDDCVPGMERALRKLRDAKGGDG